MSYASDITLEDTPFTIGLERLIDVDKPSDYIGKEALQRLAKEPIPRKLVGANFGGDPVAVTISSGTSMRTERSSAASLAATHRDSSTTLHSLMYLPTSLSPMPGAARYPRTLVDAEIVALPWFESHKKIPEGI